MLVPLAYGAKKAAKALDLTESKFLDLVESGDLPDGRMFGGKKLWAVADLEAVLNGAKIDEEFEV